MTPTTAVTLRIAGTNLMAQSVVYYDSARIADTFVDSTLLKVTVGALSTAGIHHLYVVNPAPGGGTSNTVDFTVTAPSTTGSVRINTDSPTSYTDTKGNVWAPDAYYTAATGQGMADRCPIATEQP